MRARDLEAQPPWQTRTEDKEEAGNEQYSSETTPAQDSIGSGLDSCHSIFCCAHPTCLLCKGSLFNTLVRWQLFRMDTAFEQSLADRLVIGDMFGMISFTARWLLEPMSTIFPTSEKWSDTG
jgi:hypothetical protein